VTANESPPSDAREQLPPSCPDSLAAVVQEVDVPPVIVDAMVEALDGNQPQDLLGECPYNAVRLRSELEARDVEAIVVRGGLDIPGEPTPTTAEDLPKTGLAHWWVEAEYEGTKWALDLAREGHQPLGVPLIARERPDPYVAIEEPSRFECRRFESR